jgi:hypothetical protein
LAKCRFAVSSSIALVSHALGSLPNGEMRTLSLSCKLDDVAPAQQGEEKEEKLRRKTAKRKEAVDMGVKEEMATGRELGAG